MHRGYYVCGTCGSSDVVSDGPMKWDMERQDWVAAGSPYDDDYCESCEDECRAVWVTDEPTKL